MPMSVSLDRLYEFDRLIMDLRASGMSYKAIAAEMGRKERMISSRFSKLLALPPTLSDDEAARRIAASQLCIGTPVPKTIDEMTQDDIDLVRLYRSGKTIVAIAAETGRNHKSLSCRLCKLRKALGTEIVPALGDIGPRIAPRVSAASAAVELKCLCCRRTFKSWCRMRNRICANCKSSDAAIDYLPEARICV